MYVDTSCSEATAPVRMQRAEGRVGIAFHHRAGATRLKTLFQEGCGKARLPKPLAGEAPQAVLINTAGGLTGGDRFDVSVAVERDAVATISTQACERVYRSIGDDAKVQVSLKVAPGARLAWLPQETILFDNSWLARGIDIDLEGDAELLAVEAVLFGRAAMGETVRRGAFHDRWRVRRDGHVIFADDLKMSGEIQAQLNRPAVLGRQTALATVIHAVREPGKYLDAVRQIIGDSGGASAWNGKLVVRIAADTGLALRRHLEPLLKLLLDGRALPKMWHL